ncbi:MAG: serine acetyltransferase [Erysipelotrichales bacterium]|nr:serine acetyltransferase [Erysipelotrichales bacterium]
MAVSYEDCKKELDAVSDPEIGTVSCMPNRMEIVTAIRRTQNVLFPGVFKRADTVKEDFEKLNADLARQIALAKSCDEKTAEELADAYMKRLPEVKTILLTDVTAIYNGDPAAKSKTEIIVCYPGFLAIFIYRIAHLLRTMDIPYIPRIMTEYAHEKTGIDINPGAVIGESFCIDHGTGIVIGETSVIGHHVKLYQGVTIGAKSFENDENGFPVKGGKRHPDLGNYVTVYANATILGGDTKIADRCVIGGNVWLTHSVPEDTTVIYQSH